MRGYSAAHGFSKNEESAGMNNNITADCSASNEDEPGAVSDDRQVGCPPMSGQVSGPQLFEELPVTPHNTPRGSPELTACQHAAIAAIVTGDTYTDVCKALGIDRKTLYDWRQQPRFAAELDAEVKALRESARTRLWSLADLAVDALRDVLTSYPKDAVVVSAARIVFDRLGLAADVSQGTAAPHQVPRADPKNLSERRKG
jgi:hypothetical protein